METKKERSIRIAEDRTNRVIEDLLKLGKIVDRDYYVYTEDELNKIIAAVEKEVENLKEHFRGGKRKAFHLTEEKEN